MPGQPAGRPQFQAITKVRPTQLVREQILQEIANGSYAPGDLLPSERVLGDMFAVSRVSIREAIAGLAAMGVVTVQHGRGCFVAEPAGDRYTGPFGDWLRRHHDQMVELLKVRGALDGLAAFEAAGQADAAALARLASIHQRYRRLVEKEQPALDALVSLDVNFHAAIAEASGSRLLSGLLAELATHTADSRRLTFVNKDQPRRSWAEHDAILSAIRGRDPEAARQRAVEHIDSVLKRLEPAVSGEAEPASPAHGR